MHKSAQMHKFLMKQWWRELRLGNFTKVPSMWCKKEYNPKYRHHLKSIQRFDRKLKPFQKLWDAEMNKLSKRICENSNPTY